MLIRSLKTKITDKQKLLAGKLSAIDTRLSANKKKMILALFCFLFGAISIYVIVATVTRRFLPHDLPVNPITIPYHIGKNFHQPGVVIDEDTYNRIEHFKHYLDSLKINNIGRYTEIMNTRPHLYDSILAFEKIYFIQLKK
ncbi:MAG TPA: hypothetical protein VK787_07065 [Puia sp.]|jgi:hypothetical protein|nr:hypothetical protein [Puia sp.]